MIGVSKLEMAKDQIRSLPLAFRTIYYKEIPENQRKLQAYRIDRQRSVAVVTKGFEKPISRI